jgi:putative sterol carrier protein
MSDGQMPTSMQDFDASQLAAMVAGATDEQLAEGMSDPENRKTVLDEIFRRMAEHVEPTKVQGADAVVHFHILDRPDGGADTYEVVLRNGECTTTDQPTEQPRVTFKLKPADFLRLVSGNQAGPVMFMSGKLKIEGDLMFASQVATFFRVPQTGASGAPGAGSGA